MNKSPAEEIKNNQSSQNHHKKRQKKGNLHIIVGVQHNGRDLNLIEHFAIFAHNVTADVAQESSVCVDLHLWRY